MEQPVRSAGPGLNARPRRRAPFGLLAPGTTWLLLFFAIPTASMFAISLQTGSLERGFRQTFHVQTYAHVLSLYHTQLVRSIAYGAITTIVCLCIAYPLAYAIAFHGGRWRNALLFMVVLPFFVSFIIRTLSWKFILADQGFVLGALKHIGLLSQNARVLATPLAVISGLVYNFLPFMTLPLYVSLEKMDKSLLDAANDLYSSRASAFRRVTLPLSLPGIVAGSLLTFIPAVGDYINATLLGGVNTTMIGNVIEREYLTNSNYPAAAALSFVLMVAIIIGVFAYARAVGTEELTG